MNPPLAGSWFAQLPHSLPVFSLAAVFALLFAGCEEPQTLPDLPAGPQTFTGVILPTELSLSRRGTHRLEIDGQVQYFLESTQVNLRRYEDQYVRVTGTLEHNIDPYNDPTVLIVTEAQLVEGDTFTSWRLQSLGLTLEAPEQWNGVVKGGEAEFRIPDLETPIVHIYSRAKEEDEVLSGAPIMLDARRASREIDEQSGNQLVNLELDEQSLLVFAFTPAGHASADRLREQWLALLKSVQWHRQADTQAATGSGSGAPCGGPAGILCEPGYFCDVTHLEENIGRCVKL